MKIIQNNIWFCPDCLMVACNDDPSGIESENDVADTYKGLEKFGPNLVPNFDSETGNGILEFSWLGCDCCMRNRNKGGTLHRFAVLGE